MRNTTGQFCTLKPRRLVPAAPKATEGAALEQECRNMWAQVQRSPKAKL
jgi:hypothetical protein